MKKIILLLIALIVVFISGCDSAADIQPEATFHIDNIEYDVEFTAADLNEFDPDIFNSETDNYIYLSRWKIESEQAFVDIQYPQINVTYDNPYRHFVDMCNGIILKEFTVGLSRGFDNSDGELKYIANYKVDFKATLLTGNILSICWYGEGYFDHEQGSAGPETYTLILNLETGKRMCLSDFVKIDDELFSKIQNSKSIVTINDNKDMYDSLNYARSEAELKKISFDNSEFSGVYLTKDSIFISLPKRGRSPDIYVEIER